MTNAKTAKRSCGTCRDRRLLCDRATPTCLRCSSSKRHCKGYGLRLSWPRAGDSRRAVVVEQALHWHEARPKSDAQLVHISPWDIEMHYYMTASPSYAIPQPTLFIPVLWNPSIVKAGDGDLLQYFRCAASRSLTTFDHDNADLCDTLMRIALSNNTPSAAAVLKSLLALSSLHRYGMQRQALSLKVSSLGALVAASKGKLGTMETLQHTAAGMLLCSFEVHQASSTSSQWMVYLAGIKDVLYSSGFRSCHHDVDYTALGTWVYYHDVLARFTLRHWEKGAKLSSNKSNTKSSTDSRTSKEASLELPNIAHFISDDRIQLCGNAPPKLATLQLLSDVCDAVSTKPGETMSGQELGDYKSLLSVLDWRTRTLPVLTKDNEPSDVTTMAELYQLAISVYLHRATGNLLGQSARTQQQIERAFTLISQLGSCERQFPVFIFGCEAQTDDHRAIILDLISRTEKRVSSRSLNHVKIIVQAVWAQDDLADCELNYWDKLSSIISSCSIVPSLV